jgi:riboflavin kinase/FMN adenylyltransferase
VQLIRDIAKIDGLPRGGALTMGNFDGVHQGHARIIERLNHWASRVDGPSVVFTFDPHPVRLLRPEKAPPPLTWTQRKADLLAELDVDVMIAWPTDRQLLRLSYTRFFDEIVRQRIGAAAIVEGPNFFFGHEREGDVEKLATLCAASSMAFEVVEPALMSGHLISSSRVRQAIACGDTGAACHMLTRPYRIRGMVVHGAGRGTGLGFPTANLDAVDTLIPGHGVYCGLAQVGQTGDNTPRLAAIHIGPSPTFGDERPQVEVHIIDFNESIYGEILEVDFLDRLRGVLRFETTGQLLEQMQIDVAQARTAGSAWLTRHPFRDTTGT